MTTDYTLIVHLYTITTEENWWNSSRGIKNQEVNNIMEGQKQLAVADKLL